MSIKGAAKGAAKRAAKRAANKAKKAAVTLGKKTLARLKKEAKKPGNQEKVRNMANKLIKQFKQYDDEPQVQNLLDEVREFLQEDFVHEYPCSNSIWDFILPLLIIMIIVFTIMSCMKNK